MNDKPRQQYYAFAHQALPEIFFNDPAGFIHTLETDGATFPRYLWQKIGEYANAEEDTADLIETEIHFEKGYTLSLITLPPPRRVTEAYFIALLFRSSENGDAEVRYITLEYGLTLEGDPYTVLGEWANKDMHRHWGPGPEPVKEEFLAKVISEFLD